MHLDLYKFGAYHNKLGLAGTVVDLYDAPLKDSSRKTYSTGQRAYFSFVANTLRSTAPILPFRSESLNATELYLSFFMASLVLKTTISSASTVLGYETHCKYLFRTEGCDPSA